MAHVWRGWFGDGHLEIRLHFPQTKRRVERPGNYSELDTLQVLLSSPTTRLASVSSRKPPRFNIICFLQKKNVLSSSKTAVSPISEKRHSIFFRKKIHSHDPIPPPLRILLTHTGRAKSRPGTLPSIKTTQPLDLFFFFCRLCFANFWPRELPTSGSGVARGFPTCRHGSVM